MILKGHIDEEYILTLVFVDKQTDLDAKHLYQIYKQLSNECEEDDYIIDEDYDEFDGFKHPKVDDSGFEIRDEYNFVYAINT